MLFLGCDPDMHAMAFAWVDETLQVKHITVAGGKGPWKEQAAILEMAKAIEAIRKHDWELPTLRATAFAVEAQEIYPSGPNKTKNPRNILHLGNVAGIALGLCSSLSDIGYFPLPTQWKGQLDKLTHHRRILHHAGITSHKQMGGKEPYLVPMGAISACMVGFNDGDWKHIVDAIGLAQYAATCYLDNQRKQKYLNQARNPSPGVPT